MPILLPPHWSKLYPAPSCECLYNAILLPKIHFFPHCECSLYLQQCSETWSQNLQILLLKKSGPLPSPATWSLQPKPTLPTQQGCQRGGGTSPLVDTVVESTKIETSKNGVGDDVAEGMKKTGTCFNLNSLTNSSPRHPGLEGCETLKEDDSFGDSMMTSKLTSERHDEVEPTP